MFIAWRDIYLHHSVLWCCSLSDRKGVWSVKVLPQQYVIGSALGTSLTWRLWKNGSSKQELCVSVCETWYLVISVTVVLAMLLSMLSLCCSWQRLSESVRSWTLWVLLATSLTHFITCSRYVQCWHCISLFIPQCISDALGCQIELIAWEADCLSGSLGDYFVTLFRQVISQEVQ